MKIKDWKANSCITKTLGQINKKVMHMKHYPYRQEVAVHDTHASPNLKWVVSTHILWSNISCLIHQAIEGVIAPYIN